MTAARAWADFSSCRDCGAAAGARCYDKNNEPKLHACKLRKERVRKVLPVSLSLVDMSRLLADRTEQVRNLSVEVDRLKRLLADINDLSK